MPTTAEQVRNYRGPAILSYGFRPFFLFGAIWSALAVAIWLPMLSGSAALPIALSPVDWHVHELLYGYLPAIAAGFLLTAVPNWTGRLPVTGIPLLGLLLIWIAGRLALLAPAGMTVLFVSVASLGFLALLGAVGAKAGGADVPTATARVTFWGALAMAVTAAIGALSGVAV